MLDKETSELLKRIAVAVERMATAFERSQDAFTATQKSIERANNAVGHRQTVEMLRGDYRGTDVG